MPCHILANEIADDALGKYFAHIVYQMSNPQTVTKVARIVEVFRITVFFIKPERNAGHLVAGILKQQSGNRAVSSTTHAQ